MTGLVYVLRHLARDRSALLGLTLVLMVIVILPSIRKSRSEVFAE